MKWVAYNSTPEGYEGEDVWTVVGHADNVLHWQYIRGLTRGYAESLAKALNQRDAAKASEQEAA